MHQRCAFLSSSLAVAAHYLFAERDEAQAQEFITLLIQGQGLYVGHPVLALRDRLMRVRASKLEKLSKMQTMRLIILAWNAFRQRRTLAKTCIGKRENEMPTIA